MEQIEHYQHHLIHIISEVASYGYELVVLIAGHYPLIEHARSAVVITNGHMIKTGKESVV